jgi:enoyl-CoA hydratase/carnithine racemase
MIGRPRRQAACGEGTVVTTDVSGDVKLERDGRVAVLTIDRPEARNSMTFVMYETLHDHMERLDADAEVRAIVLRGAGDKAFVSGTDIRQFLEFKTKDHALAYEARIGRVLRRIHGMTKPTIAMVQGDAVGGGLFMSLACDLRLAASHARFGAPVARTLGNCPAPSSVSLLAATVGPVRARELMLTARLVDAQEAKTLGLVDEVHAAAALERRARELAAQIATFAPLTLAAAKEATRRILQAFTVREAEDLLLSCYLSEDFQEGVRAFLEKRPADWKGR